MKKVLRVTGIIVLIIVLVILATAGLSYRFILNDRVEYTVKQTYFPLTTEQKLEDFEYLYQTLKQCFPYFGVKKRQYGTDWLSGKEEFRNMIEQTKSDAEFYEALEYILMQIQNGHTGIIEPESIEEYSRIYSGHNPWSQVYCSSRISEAYDYWQTVVSESDDICLPVSFKYIEGEYYAIGNPADPYGKPEDFGIPSGSRLCEIDGVSTDEYISGLMGSRFLKYDRMRQKAKVNTFVIYSGKPVELILETPSGERVKTKLEPQLPVTQTEGEEKMPEHLFSALKLEKDGIAYLRLPSFSALYVEKDSAGIRAFLKEIRDYRSLIIDIRGNGGGSTNYWQRNIVSLLTDKPLAMKCYVLFRNLEYLKPFLKHKLFYGYFSLKDIKNLNAGNYAPEYYFPDGSGRYAEIVYKVMPNDPVGFRGKIYLLVDDRVFSASESFAAFAKATGWATLVGTDTGGDGIGYDPIPVVLPNSGLIIRFPGEMGLNPDGSINEEVKTAPDVYAEQTYEDFMTQIRESNINDDIFSRMEYDTVLRKAFELAKSAD